MEFQISSTALHWTNVRAMRSVVVAQHTGSDTAIRDHGVQYGKLDTVLGSFVFEITLYARYGAYFRFIHIVT